MVKAQETNLEGVLEGTRQYQVPLYQRVYSWGPKQLRQLWEDVVEIADVRRSMPEASHFIGSLVLATSPAAGAVGVTPYLVVDGQQRLTTLTLLLAAVRDHRALHEGDKHRDRIDSQFLVNKYEDGEPTKLLPTQSDREAYLAAIRGTAHAGGDDAIGNAYRFFRARLEEADLPEDLDDIGRIENAVLRGLALVAVTAQAGDNAHRIFESLNNTGLKLTQGDLLRNYLFMRLGARAEYVYDTIWLPLEKELSSENLELLFWLDLVRTDERAKQSETYFGQQRILDRLTTVEQIETEVKRIAGLGSLLATMLDPARERHGEIRRRLERLRAWGTVTAYPVILLAMARRAAGTATDAEVVGVLTYLESYFVRRIVTGRATNGLNRTLMQAVQAIADAPRLDTAVRDFLVSGRKYFATDDQVREAVSTVPFYWQGRVIHRKLILFWLEESYAGRELVGVDGLTVEHVMPQTLSPRWRADVAASLDEGVEVVLEHERLVHTLGNLTLSGYNSELSNRPFEEKRALLADSGLKMNRIIADEKTWGTSQILQRAAEIAEAVIRLWPGPDDAQPSGVRRATDQADQWHVVAAAIAEIPAGRWTTFGDVAAVAGSTPAALGNHLQRQPIVNAHRVLRNHGEIIPFDWPEQDRTDDQREVLEAEGIRFDTTGRATPDQRITAEGLAALVGLDVVSEIDGTDLVA